MHYPLDLDLLKSKIPLVHAMNFISEDATYGKLCVDLHWSLLHDIPSKHFNPHWIDHATPCKLHHIQLAALNANHLLYQICVHGAKYSPVPLYRWVIDAISLMQVSHSDLNWNVIIQHAKRDRLVLPIRDTLSYLKRHFDAPIPVDVIQELEKISVSWIQKLDFKAKKQSSLLSAINFWNYHSYAMNDRPFFVRLLTFPRFLKDTWELKYKWQLIYYIPFKICKKLQKITKKSIYIL